MASAFGGGSSQSAFGARAGATVLSKATAVLAVLFMLGALVWPLSDSADPARSERLGATGAIKPAESRRQPTIGAGAIHSVGSGSGSSSSGKTATEPRHSFSGSGSVAAFAGPGTWA